MAKKTIVLGLVGALGVAAFGSAASADSFRHQPQPQAPVAAPVRPVFEHRIKPATPVIPQPPVTQPTAYGQWTWNGYRYVWVARQPTPAELRAERFAHMEQARKMAEEKRIAQGRREAEMRREQEAKRAEQDKARREHGHHEAPDGTRVRYGHK